MHTDLFFKIQMESSSKTNKTRKGKEPIVVEEKPKRQKREGRSLVWDLIDQCPSSSLRSKKIRADEEGLEDWFEDLGDMDIIERV